jgi:hypothetical protein
MSLNTSQTHCVRDSFRGRDGANLTLLVTLCPWCIFWRWQNLALSVKWWRCLYSAMQCFDRQVIHMLLWVTCMEVVPLVAVIITTPNGGLFKWTQFQFLLFFNDNKCFTDDCSFFKWFVYRQRSVEHEHSNENCRSIEFTGFYGPTVTHPLWVSKSRTCSSA